MQNFENQVVIVTGGSRGIGRALSQAFLLAGAQVVATYNSDHQKAQSFKAELGSLGERLDLRHFDVSQPQEVEIFWQAMDEKFPQIHVLINNSGIRKDSLGAAMNELDWQRVIDVNLSGAFYMSKRAILSMMKKRYGRIINMSSVGARLALPGQCNYAASKAAQIAMSNSLAKEVGKRGITVNSVCPGFIETELLEGLSAEQINEYKAQVPLKRFGTPEEVACAVLFLASRQASYITGSTLEVAGGL